MTAPGATGDHLLATARSFERSATAVRIPFHLRLRYWTHCLGLARRGVMVHSPTRDAACADSHWWRIRDQHIGFPRPSRGSADRIA
jgi:hypothetical protein